MPARFLGEAKVSPLYPIPPGILSPTNKPALTTPQGLAIITITRAGFLGSIRVGSGILIARLEDGSWSAPSAVATAGLGFGGQFGIELTDFVFILNERALQTFSRTGSLTLSGNISIAFGPFGRSAEVSGGASTSGLASMFSYSKTVGMYGGLTIEGGMLVERKGANRKFYKTKVTAEELLRGQVPLPGATQSLMRVLGHKIFDPPAEMEASADQGSREIAQPDGMVELSARAEAQPPSELAVDSSVRGSGFVPELDGTPSTQPAELPSEMNAQSAAELPADRAERPLRKSLRQDSGEPSEMQDVEPAAQSSREPASDAETTAQAKPMTADAATEADATTQPGFAESVANNNSSPQPRSGAFIVNA